MKKIRDYLKRPSVTGVLLILAVALLLGGTIGTARAALTIFSQEYVARVEMKNIGVELYENGTATSGSNLLKDLLSRAGDKELKPGKQYSEQLYVKNSGTIDQFVRVTVYKYWLDADGKKNFQLDPELIKLSDPDSGWLVDTNSKTDTLERNVYYFNKALGPGEATTNFLQYVIIDKKIQEYATQTVNEALSTANCTVIDTIYDYNGKQFCISVYVDAVQTHNAQEVIKSAWGVDVTVSDSSLSLA